jgi:hypothetical protein
VTWRASAPAVHGSAAMTQIQLSRVDDIADMEPSDVEVRA